MKFCIHQQDELECKDCRVAVLQQEVARLRDWKDSAMKVMASWDDVTKYLQGEGFDVKDLGGTWQEAILRRLKEHKAAESSLLAMREALEKARRSHTTCEDAWYSCPLSPEGCANDSVGDECDCGANDVNAIIDDALSTTSSQAEGIKARWQAEALRGAAKEIRMTTYDRVQIVAYMDARAAQLTAKTGEGNAESGA